MASSDVRDAELASLSGSELVERLRTTCRLADYEATARELDARDRRLAKAEAALAEAKEDLDARDVRIVEAEAALAEAKEGLDARDRRLAKAEAELAEAKEGLDARDVRIAKTEAQLAEAKEGLDARDVRIAKAEAALAEAKEGRVRPKIQGRPSFRGRRILRGGYRSSSAGVTPLPQGASMMSVPTFTGATGVSEERISGSARETDPSRRPLSDGEPRSEGTRGEPRSEGARGESRSEDARRGPRDEAARPGDAIAAPSPAQRGELRAEVAEEEGLPVIDLCSSDEEEREGSRGKVSGVSRKRKPTASEVIEEEGCRARVSQKRNVAASARSSDDEDDTLTLTQLLKQKHGRAQPGDDGEPKNADSTLAPGDYLPEVSLVVKEGAIEATVGGSDEPNVATFVQERGNVKLREDGGMSRATLRRNLKLLSTQQLDSAIGSSAEKNFSKDHVAVRTSLKEGSLGNDLPKTPVITEQPEIRVTGSDFVHGRGNEKSAGSGVSRAPPPGFTATTGSLPPGFAARTDSQKNLSRADHGGPRTSGKDDSFAGQEEDTLVQLKNSSRSARKNVESARVGAVSPKGHTGSALGDNIILGLEDSRQEERTNGGGHNSKVLPGTNAIKEQVRCGMIVGAIREQDETKGLVHKRIAMPETNDIGKKHGQLSSCQSRETKNGGDVGTSDKQLGSATLLPKDELHSGQTSVEGSLPPAVTRNWNSAIDMLASCIENNELCMQAVCALYRQKKLMFQPTGGQSGSSGLCKSDAHRVAKLVEFLLDGDVQGPLKRTTEELGKHDLTGRIFLHKVVYQFIDQLFSIYKNKEDPYFC